MTFSQIIGLSQSYLCSQKFLKRLYANNLLIESEGSTGNIQPRSCCIDRVIARSIQQDRGWVFFRTARTVEVSKFFIIWHCMFVKKWGKKGHAMAKYKVRNICKKTIVKMFSCMVSKILYTAFLYRILTQFGKYFKKNTRYFVI